MVISIPLKTGWASIYIYNISPPNIHVKTSIKYCMRSPFQLVIIIQIPKKMIKPHQTSLISTVTGSFSHFTHIFPMSWRSGWPQPCPSWTMCTSPRTPPRTRPRAPRSSSWRMWWDRWQGRWRKRGRKPCWPSPVKRTGWVGWGWWGWWLDGWMVGWLLDGWMGVVG